MVLQALEAFSTSSYNENFMLSMQGLLLRVEAHDSERVDAMSDLLATGTSAAVQGRDAAPVWKTYVTIGTALFICIWICNPVVPAWLVCAVGARRYSIVQFGIMAVQMPLMAFVFAPFIGFLFQDWLRRPWPKWTQRNHHVWKVRLFL